MSEKKFNKDIKQDMQLVNICGSIFGASMPDFVYRERYIYMCISQHWKATPIFNQYLSMIVSPITCFK